MRRPGLEAASIRDDLPSGRRRPPLRRPASAVDRLQATGQVRANPVIQLGGRRSPS